MSLIKVVRMELIGGAWGDCRREKPPSPNFSRSLCRDLMKYAQNLTGSLSSSSSESQVTQRGLCGIHSLSKVVFPNPAGAAIRVSFLSNPASKRSIKRGRETRFFRGRGMNNFVLRSSNIKNHHSVNKPCFRARAIAWVRVFVPSLP
jgi:hypothetical protein